MARILESAGAIAEERANAEGEEKSQREVTTRLGLADDKPVHDLLEREKKKGLQGIAKQREGKPTRPVHALLRYFLSDIERK